MRERYEPIDTTRFSILKMHGRIGTLRKHNRVGGKPVCDFGKVPVSDDLLRAFQRDHWRESPTMIFFPWEASGAPDWTRALIEGTDRAAEAFLAGVEELKIVGYSFHDLNRPRFERLLAKARGCKVIDLYDPSEESWLRLQSLTRRLNIPAKPLWHKGGWQP
jgi:hypothetical protein